MSWEVFCDLHNVGQRLRKASISSSNLISSTALNLGKVWIENPVKSLYLQGECGTGKTHFMHCLIRGLIERFSPKESFHIYHLANFIFMKSKALDDRITYEDREYKTCQNIVDRASKTPFLFLDDLGIEKESAKSEREYCDIFDYRVEHDLPTIITSNISLSEVRSVFGVRIHSRLKTFLHIPFGGGDLREKL